MFYFYLHVNVAIGYRPFNSFISGSSIILSKTIALRLYNQYNNNNRYSSSNRNDDVLHL